MQSTLVTLNKSSTLFTGVAQRERAGLITPRSLVQTQPPVLFNSPALQKPVVKLDIKRSNQTFTGMAQRQRAGLITPRSLDRNGLPVFSYSCVLQKHAVNASDFKQAHTICCRYSSAAERLKLRLLPFRLFGSDLGMVIPLITGRS